MLQHVESLAGCLFLVPMNERYPLLDIVIRYDIIFTGITSST